MSFTIANREVQATVDMTQPRSKLSSAWMARYGRELAYQTRLSITMHTLEDGDQIVELDFLHELASKMPTDVVLGLDWVQGIATSFGVQAGTSPLSLRTASASSSGQVQSQSTETGCMPVDDRAKNIADWFFNRSSGLYLLSQGSSDLDRVLRDHSVDVQNMDFFQRRRALVHHILGGLCSAKRSHACVAFAQCQRASDLRQIAYLTLENIMSTLFGEDAHIRSILSDLGVDRALFLSREDMREATRVLLTCSSEHAFPDVCDFHAVVDRMTRAQLLEQHFLHGIEKGKSTSVLAMRENVCRHFIEGQCSTTGAQFDGCFHVIGGLPSCISTVEDTGHALRYLSVQHVKGNALKSALRRHGVAFSPNDGPSKMRRLLKQHVRASIKGKRVADNMAFESACNSEYSERARAEKSWPPKKTKAQLDQLVEDFHRALSSDSLTQVVCASCSERIFKADADIKPLSSMDLSPLTRPDKSSYVRPDRQSWLEPNYPEPPLPFDEDFGPDIMLDPSGILQTDGEEKEIVLCVQCSRSLFQDHTPSLALANKMFLGNVPPELQNLTAIEESMISLCRSKCMIVQLRKEREGGNDGDPDSDTSRISPNSQRSYRGHVIVYPQNVNAVANLLPPSVEEIVAPICVVFIGHHKPTRQWIQEHAKPLAVNAKRVRCALLWLKKHNPLYRDVIINKGVLQSLSDQPVLPFHVEHLDSRDSADTPTSRYDKNTEPFPENDLAVPPLPANGSHPASINSLANDIASDSTPLLFEPSHKEVPFENLMIADVDGGASSNELRAAAMRHMKEHGKDFVAISHEDSPERDFNNPTLFPKMFPTLYPYGLGGMEDPLREAKVSMVAHVRHLMNYSDRRFQLHPSFMFIAFNILQRRRVLLESHLRVERDTFDKIVDLYENIAVEDIEAVTDRVARGDYSTAFNDGERNVLQLLREVEVVTTTVPGSAASRVAMRNEIRGMIHNHGLPSFYLTINPADIYSPVLSFLSGNEFDLDKFLPENSLGYWKQSMLVAKNPAVTALFFNVFIKAFIKTLLGYEGPQSKHEGVLGLVKSYYGCVEAQGRGSLHCHMVVWIEGCLSPDEIRAKLKEEPDGEFRSRLVAYLEEAISTSIPDDGEPLRRKFKGSNPCGTRGPRQQEGESAEDFERRKLLDFAELVRACQIHRHSSTCYKYCKKGEKKVCRFGLDEGAIVKESVVDSETGALNLKKLDGMVNNFNATILRAIRCNMDIQFIPSGPDAKAVLYYITDYIAKSQLPTHVAYATLEVAVKKLDRPDHNDSPTDVLAKHLLRKCANALLGRQELSAQQVASYAMCLDDHFTSHQFRKLYWTPFETYLDNLMPSPECYRKSHHGESSGPCNYDDAGRVQQHDEAEVENDEEGSVDDPDAMDVDDGPLYDNEVPDTETLHGAVGGDFWLGVDKEGRVRPRFTKVADYVLRGHELDTVALWDFVAQVDKRAFTASEEFGSADDAYALVDNECGEDQDEDAVEDVLVEAAARSIKSSLCPSHCHADSHKLHVRKPSARFLPVLSGPAVPRRSVVSEKARYSRLMLLLFKPWRSPEDLRGESLSWIEACDAFLQSAECPSRVHRIVSNIQALHECKQARDAHMSANVKSGDFSRIPANFVESAICAEAEQEHDLSAGNIEDEVLSSLQHIQDIYSERNLQSLEEAEGARQRVDDCRLYNFAPKEVVSGEVEEVRDSEDNMENIWRQTYKVRREVWRDPEKAEKLQEKLSKQMQDPKLQAVAEIRNAASYGKQSERRRQAPAVSIANRCSKPGPKSTAPTNNECDELPTVEAISKKLTLNREQRLALSIVARQADAAPNTPPLRMYVGGPAGTGKSRVVDAITMFFNRRKEEARLKLSAFMGIAARNIQGHTLHSLLSLASIKGKGVTPGVATTLRRILAEFGRALIS